MDCNNYSYINYGSDCHIIAETENGLNGLPVTFELCVNYFNDKFYFVSDLGGDCGEFEFSDILKKYDNQKTAYEKAARFYNSLVTEKDAIPLF